MELHELVLGDSEELGVDFIALVDSPAIQMDWQLFKEVKQNFKIKNEEKRIISGYIMRANYPILRQINEEFVNVFFSKQTIFDINLRFMSNGYNKNTNLDHDRNQLADGVFLFESFLIDSDRGLTPPKGFEEAEEGSWFGSMYVENEDVWQQVKEGKFNGFSVEAQMEMKTKPVDEDEQKVNEIMALIEEFEKNN